MALLREFPNIKHDISQASEDTGPLISKLRKVRRGFLIPMYTHSLLNSYILQPQIMKGAHAARNADANMIRHNIFTLSHDDAKRRGWTMPAIIDKANCGIKSECTAQFLLPFTERVKYLDDPATYVLCMYNLSSDG